MTIQADKMYIKYQAQRITHILLHKLSDQLSRKLSAHRPDAIIFGPTYVKGRNRKRRANRRKQGPLTLKGPWRKTRSSCRARVPHSAGSLRTRTTVRETRSPSQCRLLIGQQTIG